MPFCLLLSFSVFFSSSLLKLIFFKASNLAKVIHFTCFRAAALLYAKIELVVVANIDLQCVSAASRSSGGEYAVKVIY